jgi:hypothetical protein
MSVLAEITSVEEDKQSPFLKLHLEKTMVYQATNILLSAFRQCVGQGLATAAASPSTLFLFTPPFSD